jgi:flavin reductase
MQQVADRVQVEAFNRRDFRDTLGAFATGVTVITTQGAGEPYGMTANAFSSVSLDPPLVLICVVSGTRGSESIQRNGVFAVNVLSDEQEALSRFFSSRDRPGGPDAFAGIAHRRGVTGSPLLDGVAAYLDCRLHAEHEAGDHTIFVGEVLAIGREPGAEPLVFFGGRYRSLNQETG